MVKKFYKRMHWETQTSFENVITYQKIKTASKKLLSLFQSLFLLLFILQLVLKKLKTGTISKRGERKNGKWEVMERSQVTGIIHKRLAECLFLVKQWGRDGNVTSLLKMRASNRRGEMLGEQIGRNIRIDEIIEQLPWCC